MFYVHVIDNTKGQRANHAAHFAVMCTSVKMQSATMIGVQFENHGKLLDKKRYSVPRITAEAPDSGIKCFYPFEL